MRVIRYMIALFAIMVGLMALAAGDLLAVLLCGVAVWLSLRDWKPKPPPAGRPDYRRRKG